MPSPEPRGDKPDATSSANCTSWHVTRKWPTSAELPSVPRCANAVRLLVRRRPPRGAHPRRRSTWGVVGNEFHFFVLPRDEGRNPLHLFRRPQLSPPPFILHLYRALVRLEGFASVSLFQRLYKPSFALSPLRRALCPAVPSLLPAGASPASVVLWTPMGFMMAALLASLPIWVEVACPPPRGAGD